MSIAEKFKPTNPEVLEQVDALRELYKERTRRVYTGSIWVILSAVAIMAIALWGAGGGVDRFFIIHTLGLAFYILASQTPVYVLEKRAQRARGGSVLGAVIGGVLFSSNTRYYRVDGDGRKERAYDLEGGGFFMALLVLAVVVLLCGFLIASSACSASS